MSKPSVVSTKSLVYTAWAILFFGLSLLTITFVFHAFADGSMSFTWDFLTVKVALSLLVLLVVYYMADGIRLYCVLKAMGYDVPFLYLFKLVFINLFISNVTPMATGGGFAQVYFLNQIGIPVGIATAATSVRTLIAALFIFVFAPLFIWLNPAEYQIFSLASLKTLILLVSCSYLLGIWALIYRVSVVKNLLHWLLGQAEKLQWISTPTAEKYQTFVDEEIRAFTSGIRQFFSGQLKYLVLSAIATFAFLVALFSFSVILLSAMGYSVPIFHVYSFQTVITFFMYFTPTPGGTGVAEGGYGLLFANVVNSTDLVFLTILWRSLTIYVGVFIGIFYFYREILKLKRG